MTLFAPPARVQGSFPLATVTVYLSGTVTLATIFADDMGTPKPNPFTAGSDGEWFFYAANGLYDVRFSGAGIPAPFTIGGISAFDETYFAVDVSLYGAKGDGVTDDSAALAAAVAAAVAQGGGTIQFGAGRIYKTTQTLLINGSNIIVELNGSEILFQPTVISGGTPRSDRALMVVTPSAAITGPFNTNGAAIAKGATSFVTASSLPANAGDWIMICEIEPNMPGGPDVCTFDWLQVASIAGTTVNLYTAFNVAFSGLHSTPICFVIARAGLVENVVVRNGRATITNSTTLMPAFTAANCKNVRFENLVASARFGQGYYCYRCNGFTVTNCISTIAYAASEFAESVNVTITGNIFDHNGSAPGGPVLRINMGTNQFMVANNVMRNAGSTNLYILDGPRDGVVTGNTFGFVQLLGFSAGMFARGVQNVIFTNNYMDGGDVSGSTGVNFIDQTGMVSNILSAGNVIAWNTLVGFTSPYPSQGPADLYIRTDIANVGGGPYPTFKNGLVLGDPIFTLDALLGLRAPTRVIAERQEIEGNSTYYRGFDIDGAGNRRTWWAFNSFTNRDVWFNEKPLLVINNNLAQGGLQVGQFGNLIRAIYTGGFTFAPADWSADPIPANSTATATLNIPNAGINDVVVATPVANPGAGLSWCARMIDDAGNVEIRMTNCTTAGIFFIAIHFAVVVIRFQ